MINVWESNDGWRWRCKARNGRIVAESGEAYSSMAKAVRAAYRTQQIMRVARIEVEP